MSGLLQHILEILSSKRASRAATKKAPDFLAGASLTLIFIVACLVVYVSALFLHVKQLFGGEIVGLTLFLIGLLLRFQIRIVSLTEPLQQIGVV